MKKAEVIDNWDKVYKRHYSVGLESVDLDGLNNFNQVTFTRGISAICGLNGAGKSTIIAAIKSALGMPLAEGEIHKLKDKVIAGKFMNNKTTIDFSNQKGKNLNDIIPDVVQIEYLDCKESDKVQEFNINQSNFDELLEQYEEYVYLDVELEEINYLTGKRYKTCSVWEFEDIEEIGTVPYFKVSIDDIEYDSRSMGKGEHFLLFMFWCINQSNSGTIFIIEEPETYISISSQMHFANYIGMKMAEKGIQVIMTTHSPYLLEHIKNENIRIVSRMGSNVAIVTPDSNLMAEEILGVHTSFIGTFFVEDRVAYDFLSVILEDKAPYILKKYNIIIAEGGETAITRRLQFPKDEKIKYNFVGIYDGDMRERLNTEVLQWKYAFLPGTKPLEELYREFLYESQGVQIFSQYIEKPKDSILTILSTIEGDDCHDWFEGLRKYLGLDGKALIRIFYNVMGKMNDAIEDFIEELKMCID